MYLRSAALSLLSTPPPTAMAAAGGSSPDQEMPDAPDDPPEQQASDYDESLDPAEQEYEHDESLYPTESTAVALTFPVGGTERRPRDETVAETLRYEIEEGPFAGEWLVKVCNRSADPGGSFGFPSEQQQQQGQDVESNEDQPKQQGAVARRRRVVRLHYGGGYVTTVRLNHSSGVDGEEGGVAPPPLADWEGLPVEHVGVNLCLGGMILGAGESLVEMAECYYGPDEIPANMDISIGTEPSWLEEDGVESRTIEVWESEHERGCAAKLKIIGTTTESNNDGKGLKSIKTDGSLAAEVPKAEPTSWTKPISSKEKQKQRKKAAGARRKNADEVTTSPKRPTKRKMIAQ